jgi:ATP-dependent exoDNAse (exonuclease V) beta subunit
MVWHDPARGHTVQIITGLAQREPVEEAKPVLPDAPLVLDYLHERPQTPTIAATTLEAMRQAWKEKPWEWWLRYRLHLNPAVTLPPTGLPRDEAGYGGGQLGSVVGTVVHRLFEMPTALPQQDRQAFRRLIEAMAASLLDDSADQELSFLPDPAMVRIVADAVEQIWRRLRAADGSAKPLRTLLGASGQTEVPFVLKLGRWQISGRYDKLLATERGFEIVDWKTDQEDDSEVILRRHEPQMRLYALALHRAGRAALVNGRMRVQLALLYPMVVRPLTFLPEELEAFGDELAKEFQQMGAYEPN